MLFRAHARDTVLEASFAGNRPSDVACPYPGAELQESTQQGIVDHCAWSLALAHPCVAGIVPALPPLARERRAVPRRKAGYQPAG